MPDWFAQHAPKVDTPKPTEGGDWFAAHARQTETPKPEAPKADPAPRGFLDRVGDLADNPNVPMAARAGGAVLRQVREHPVETGAMVGGLATAPFTGGMSILPAMAATGAASAAGAGAASLGRQAITGEADPSLGQTMAVQGALGAGGEGVGRLATGAAQLTGRGLYRAGLLPINSVFGKYGDVVKTGVENAVLPTQGGLVKAKGLKLAAQGEKEAAIALRDRLGIMQDANAIASAAKQKLAGKAQALVNAGEPDPTVAMNLRPDRFAAQYPQGLPPSQLETVKSTIDDRLGGAYEKLRRRMPLSAREESQMALSQAASRAQEGAVPKYRAMNKEIMDTSGLIKAVQRRTQGSGGNQGLENALMIPAMAGGNMAAIPARIAMLPPVLSGTGIALYQAAKHGGPPAAAALKALLALLGPEGQAPRPEEPIE